MSPLSKQPTRLTSRSRLRAACPAQRGAATLVVVMVLFFIVALVAAYTSRNLIFDQRTSANQYRSTQAFEAAEAGLEWALAMLNSGKINAACQPHPLANAATPDPSFRDRYLVIDADGAVTAPPRPGGEPRRAACVFDGAGWQCSCPAPADAAPALADPVGPGPFPAFVLRFYDVNTDTPPVPYPPGVVRIESTGCTRLDAAGICTTAATAGDARATVTVLAALKSALVTPPAAALTVGRDLDAGLNMLEAVNRDVSSGGLPMHVGRLIGGTPVLQGPPGSPTPPVFEDDAMRNLSADPARMFNSVFGMSRDTYRLQPATVFVDCAVDCTAATVRDMARLNPGRVLWINGDFVIDIVGPIGEAASPVVLIVDGDVSISNGGAQLNGVVYTTGDTWTNVGGLTLNGALMSKGNLSLLGGGTSRLVYEPAVLNLLRRSSGSFVRVPGSWRDF